MALDTESFNAELYDLLKVRGYKPVPLNARNQRVSASQDADVIEFQFNKDGKDYGKAWITIDGSKSIQVYYDHEQQDSPNHPTPGVEYDDTWTGFLKHVKQWAQRRQLGFDLLNKDRLNDNLAKRVHNKMKETVAEGYHSMGKKASYNDAVPNVKIVIQHSRAIEEGEQRYRNVAKIFLENMDGERFLAPTTRPGIARVYARHIAEGGVPNDDRWGHIKSICEEYNKMAGFVRATRGKQFNESAQALINEGSNHYKNLRETLSRLTGHRGYNTYFESWTPTLMEDDGDTSINELFVQETVDPRIESVMPILSRLRKNVAEVKEVDALSEWAEGVINEKLVEMDDDIGYSSTKAKPTSELDPDKVAALAKFSVVVSEEEVDEAHNKKVNVEVTDKGAVYVNDTRITSRHTKWGVHNTIFQTKVPLDQVVQTLRDNGFENIILDPQYSAEMGIQLEEDLDANQKRVGQLGPTGGPAKVGDLVGANESTEFADELTRITDIARFNR